MAKILFCYDQPDSLEITPSMHFNVGRDWEIDFANGGQTALGKLASGSFDVFVVDAGMSEAEITSVLSGVTKKFPAMVQMLCTGSTLSDRALKAGQNAERYIAKPDFGVQLLEALMRALSLRHILQDEKLKEIVAGLDTIPSLPTAYMELMKVLQKPESSMQEIGKVISKDIAMSAKIMQMVNSAFFGLPVDVKNPVHATNLLGVEVIKALVMTVHVFKSFNNNGSQRFSMDGFTNHCLSVGALAKAIAKREEQPQEIVDDAFIAGMMHDVGKLIVVSNLPDYYDRSAAYAEEHGLTYVYGEEMVYNTTHAEIGAYVLKRWGFRDSIVEAVAFHHRPSDCFGQQFSPLTAVHIADAIENEYGHPEGKAVATVHMDYLARLGLIERLEDWRQVCLETQHTLMQAEE